MLLTKDITIADMWLYKYHWWFLSSFISDIWFFSPLPRLYHHMKSAVPLKQVKVIDLVQSDDFYVIFLIVITIFSKLLRRQHFWTHCSNFCLIQEKSFRADKLMEFYKVSSYIRVFVVSLCTKLDHVSGWKLLTFQVLRLIS